MDEAHNLVDAVNAAHSATIDAAAAAAAAGQLDAYWGRFGARLAPGPNGLLCTRSPAAVLLLVI